MRHYERAIMLQSLDTHWREHLRRSIICARASICAATRRRTRQQEYKREAFELFSMMLESIKTEVTKILMTVQIRSAEALAAVEAARRRRRTSSTSTPNSRAAATPRSRRRRKATSRWPSGRSRSCARARKSGATIRARAARARSTSSAMAGSPDGDPAVTKFNKSGFRGCHVPSLGFRQSRYNRCGANLMRPENYARQSEVAGPEATAARQAGVAPGRGARRASASPARKDLLVMKLETGARVAGVFTQNRFCAAPVVVARQHLTMLDPGYARSARWWSTPATPTPVPVRKELPRRARPAASWPGS